MKSRLSLKDFEELVAAIETAVAPKGAIVALDDRIKDNITGKLRQVDVSIRFKIGTTDILILVECRARSRKQDVTWVEEAVSRLRDLNASKMVLVSSRGFSDAAKKKAKHFDIDLRKLSELHFEEIDSWLRPERSLNLVRVVEDMSCEIAQESDPELLRNVDPMEPVLVHRFFNGPFPPAVLLEFQEMRDPRSLWSVPLDGTKTELTLEFNGSDQGLIPGPSGVPFSDQTRIQHTHRGELVSISKLRLYFLVSYEACITEPANGKHFSYGGLGGPFVISSEFDEMLAGLPVKIRKHATKRRKSSTIRWSSGVTLPPKWELSLKKLFKSRDAGNDDDSETI